MRVAVRLFARARDLAGADRLEVDVPPQSNVGVLKMQLGEQCPKLRPLLPQLLVAIGTEYATDETIIHETAELACFPPVSGG